MKPGLIKNESAVSEVIGALLIFGIIVGLIGIMQSSQVPAWNAAVEQTHFDVVSSDFVKLRADIEDVEKLEIPKSTDLRMGVKYPERFVFRNPGAGASGTITTYPLHVNVSYSTISGLKWKNYTSAGIVYEMHGTERSPKLVYEHGLIIKDYGDANVTGNEPSLITGGEVFIPIVLWDDYSFSSMDIETFTMLPVPASGGISTRFLCTNATLDTMYPDVWNKSSGGSGFNVSNGKIEITGITGDMLTLPSNDTSGSSQKQCYVGMITVGGTSTSTSSTSTRGPTGPDGIDAWGEDHGRLDIPASNEVTEFIVRDITIAGLDPDVDHLQFKVADVTGTAAWKVWIKFKDGTTVDFVKIGATLIPRYTDADLHSLGYQIDLTPEYIASGIITPNVLTVTKVKDKGVLYVNFLIN
jgi:hypothetical protein